MLDSLEPDTFHSHVKQQATLRYFTPDHQRFGNKTRWKVIEPTDQQLLLFSFYSGLLVGS
jgi:hypothetical protein